MGNAKMILEGVQRAVHNVQTGQVTMEDVSVGQDEDEKRAGKKTAVEGTDYYLSVVPELGVAALRERFESTQWRVVDMFRLTRPYDPQPMAYRECALMGENGGGHMPLARYVPPHMRPGAERLLDSVMLDMSIAAPVESVPHRQLQSMLFTNSARGGSRGGDDDDDDGRRGRGGRGSRGGVEPSAYKKRGIPAAAAAAAAAPVMRSSAKHAAKKTAKRESAVSRNSIELEDDDEECDESFSSFDGPMAEFAPEAAGAAAAAAVSKPNDREALVRATQAAKVRAGASADVHSAETGKEYDYERASFPCTIGLSVSVRREKNENNAQTPVRWMQDAKALPDGLSRAIETAYQQWEDAFHHGSRDAFTWQELGADGLQTLKSISFSKMGPKATIGHNGIKRVADKTRIIGGLVISPPLTAAEEKARAADLIGEYAKQRDVLILAQVGETCAARACKRAGPFPPFTPQVVLSAARAALKPMSGEYARRATSCGL
jgi:hypothetical protein